MSHQFKFYAARDDYARLFDLVRGSQDVRVVAVSKTLVAGVDLREWRSMIRHDYGKYFRIMLNEDYQQAEFAELDSLRFCRSDLEALPIVDFNVPSDWPERRTLTWGRFYFIPEGYNYLAGGFARKPEHSIRWAKNLMARVRRHCTKVERRWVFGEHAMELVKQGYRMK